MKQPKLKELSIILVFFLSMAAVGQVAAGVIFGSYTANTLYGQIYGKAWSPTDGNFRVQIDNNNGERIATVSGRNVTWNQQAINWLQSNYYNNLSITTHSFRYADNGCGSFRAYGGFTTLPNPQVTTHVRQCWPYYPTEVRMATTNPWAMAANTPYNGDSYYIDANSTVDQKFTVDTYWGGSENWHRTFCVWAGNFYPSVC
jgi:hypothetical protein